MSHTSAVPFNEQAFADRIIQPDHGPFLSEPSRRTSRECSPTPFVGIERSLESIRTLARSVIRRRHGCRTDDDLDDVVQEAVLSLLEKGIALDDTVTGSRQVISVIDRAIYRVMRKETRRQRAMLERASELIGDPSSPSFDPACQILADDLCDFVKSRFSTFECDCLERYVELQSLRATATLIGVSLHKFEWFWTTSVLRSEPSSEWSARLSCRP